MSDIIKIGRTNYYSVRKGTHQYRIAEGKRLGDLEYCWQLHKDAEKGKHFFVNGSGQRRWHLPDIYMTEREREEEEAELKLRKDARKRAEEDAQKKEQEAEQGSQAGDKASEKESKKSDMAAFDATATFLQRERDAAQLTPLPQWEDLDSRLQVIKFVKSVITPYLTQNVLDEKNYTAIVSVATKEFCAKNPKLDDAAQAKLRDDIVSMALTRMTEEKKREEYAKLNEDLLEKVKRLDGERKELQSQVTAMTKNEDKMKDEIFKLRAHKQDILLGSFKRLTRAGLVQTYWKRWVHHKGVVEAQLDVKARERRAIEMTTKISDLEAETEKQKEQIGALNERVHKAEGRDVVTMMLKQSGTHTMKRSYLIWLKWTEEARREKIIHKLRDQLNNCPNCELRQIETERVRDRLGTMIDELREKDRVLMEAQAQRQQWEVKYSEQRELVDKLKESVAETNNLCNNFSARCLSAEDHAARADEQIRFLQNEVEKLTFEVKYLTEQSHAKLRSEIAKGGVSTSANESTAEIHGRAPLNPLDRSNFWSKEVDGGANRLHKMIVVKDHEKGFTPTRGLVNEATESALAPLVRPPLPPRPQVSESDDDDDIPPPPPEESYPHYTPAGGTGSNPFASSRAGLPTNQSAANSRHGTADILLRAPTTPSIGKNLQSMMRDNDQVGERGRVVGDDESEESMSKYYPDDDSSAGGPTLHGGTQYTSQPRSERRGVSPGPYTGTYSSGGTRGDRSPSQGAGAAASLNRNRGGTQAAPDPENDICEKCGFKKKLTQFCPRDGSRHMFIAFSNDYRDDKSLLHKNYYSEGVGAAATGFQNVAADGTHQTSSAAVPPGISSVLMGTNKQSRLVDSMNGLAPGGGNKQGTLDSKKMGLPPSRETLQKRRDQIERADLRNMLNLDPGAFHDPTATPQHVQARAQYDTSHYREVADLMRATRVSTENAIHVDRALGREPLQPVRSVLDTNPINARHDPLNPTTTAAPVPGTTAAAAGSGSRWGGLFDFHDVTDGSLGVATESVDHVFGVYRGDTMPAEPPSRKYLEEQKRTPNF